MQTHSNFHPVVRETIATLVYALGDMAQAYADEVPEFDWTDYRDAALAKGRKIQQMANDADIEMCIDLCLQSIPDD